ncbi:DNA topoisomerase 3-beta isoform X2 [Sitodiplosis mosellana]|uniref:DNA topoisomerase 3-beta isoform X2 n=1 Tax=Sitodiplosis mosellana TaxID=263140 RepID=UPI002443F534|nr:DNA topoisomerase 3-beta isoform X2 [Sitodiplosis mosellana]
MKSVLMVAEKPSLAASLANILSNGRNSNRKGSNNACSVHEWKGVFRNENVTFKMTSVCGHVMSLDFVGKYNSWDRVDPVELFTCPTEKKEATPKLRMRQFLGTEAKGCDYLVLWLDCDKEGENICFEVMDAVSRSIRNVYSNEVTYRAKFSAITEKDIKYAMNNLIRPNENEARSVDARQEIDLRIGCAFTRFQTKFFQGHYGDLDSSLISYGPCQTPTLGFCVQRHDEIQNFKPETFCVESVIEKDLVKPRPLALNTVELMRAASAGLGIGPHTAMTLAERLYTQGYISYPRTETTSYPQNFDLNGVVRLLQPSSEFGTEAKDVAQNFNSPRRGTDCGDHPPITPAKLLNRGETDNDTWRVYDYICRHFLATVSQDLRYKQTTSKFTVGSEKFSCTTNKLIDPGYTKCMTWQAFGKDDIAQSFKQGDSVKINEYKLVESQTGPPDYLTESELITLMEKHGIGTDASIPVHINNICQRNYVTIASSRRLIPTTLGNVLVHGYQKIDPELVLPTMRSDVEKALNLIAAGSADFGSVLKHAVEIFRMKFLFFVQNICVMDSLFEASFASIADSGKAFSRCGKCRRYMKYIQTKPARLHCTQCDDTYTLPKDGTVRAYKELRCPLDDFELLAFSSGTKGRSYPLCPYCYANPPFKGMPNNAGCNSCMHPTCPNSMNMLGVSVCDECDRGILVLDCTSAPKKWKLGCNSCDVIINIFNKASKVTVNDNKQCDECQAQLVTVVYKVDQTKFKDNAEEKTGCLFCSPDFIPLVEKHRAVATKPIQTNSTRGGRGRGNVSVGNGTARGGGSNRGGGRGRPPKDKMAQLAAYFV